jgi:hypothetical protein
LLLALIARGVRNTANPPPNRPRFVGAQKLYLSRMVEGNMVETRTMIFFLRRGDSATHAPITAT